MDQSDLSRSAKDDLTQINENPMIRRQGLVMEQLGLRQPPFRLLNRDKKWGPITDGPRKKDSRREGRNSWHFRLCSQAFYGSSKIAVGGLSPCERASSHIQVTFTLWGCITRSTDLGLICTHNKFCK